MLYTLPNGNTIELSVETYLSFSDDDIQYLLASNGGSNNLPAFHNSVLTQGEKATPKSDTFSGYTFDSRDEANCIEENEPELSDVDSHQKSYELDIAPDD